MSVILCGILKYRVMFNHMYNFDKYHYCFNIITAKYVVMLLRRKDFVSQLPPNGVGYKIFPTVILHVRQCYFTA